MFGVFVLRVFGCVCFSVGVLTIVFDRVLYWLLFCCVCGCFLVVRVVVVCFVCCVIPLFCV